MVVLDKVLNLIRLARRPAQMLWASPVSLTCFLFYILPCWGMGWYRYHGKFDTAWVFLHADMPKWLSDLWSHWRGQCVGNCIVLKEDPRTSPKALQLLVHELAHTRQIMTWGILQPIFYVLANIATLMAGEDTYPRNPFEIAARRAAGEKDRD